MQVHEHPRTGTPEGRRRVAKIGHFAISADDAGPAISIDHEARRVLVEDRGETFGYEFGRRRGRGRNGGLGWSELTRGDHDVVYVSGTTTADVMAVCRDGGRHREVAQITLDAAAALPASDRRQARRLAAEVQDGLDRRRISLRVLQARILACLVDGEDFSVLAERGGFVNADGRVDTTWLERRAGLMSDRCNRTGKIRTARTASYPVFCKLVAAVGAEPHEFDV